MSDNNEIRLTKIPLYKFIQALIYVHDLGIKYIDLIGTKDDEQDSIGILPSEGETMNNSDKPINLSDDLNDLI